MGFIYAIIIIIANSIGAISGMGGGVIIKPLFDLINFHPLYAISFYSSVAVLTMSVISTYKQVKNGININWSSALLLSLGSVLGGITGNIAFDFLLHLFQSDKEVQLIQIILTVITLLFSYFYSVSHWKNYSLSNPLVLILIGWFLGFLASLLGIGGGPINVAILMMLFSFPIKDATVYSIIIIFFSQLAKILTIILGGSLVGYDLTMLYYIIPSAIIGGFLGASLSGRLPDSIVRHIYQGVIIFVLVINLYNGWQLL